ncbi:MAG: hypothetical protein Q8L60_02355 [Gammaproteobacteria bacterium]|nr:hypothetical protein [Gammaproteobacteria bacterium]MDP2348792.1 hypothetical protein [Gammaproteobacteria bacterium]
MNSVSFENTAIILKGLYPYTKLVTRVVQQGTGYLSLPEASVALLSRPGLPHWSTAYEDSRRPKSLAVAAILGTKHFNILKESLKDVSERNALRIRELFKRVIVREIAKGRLSHAFDEPQILDPRVYERWYRRLSEEDKTAHQINVYLFLYALVVNSFNFASLMTFGVSICDLVARAKTGDDEALFQAVQIDKTTLSGIPYFQDRLKRASVSNDSAFFYKLGLKIQAPPISGKIKHKRLMIVFAMLDDEGFLDRPINEIFDACEMIGVYGQRFHQYDDAGLRKRLTDYLKRTGRQIRI